MIVFGGKQFTGNQSWERKTLRKRKTIREKKMDESTKIR